MEQDGPITQLLASWHAGDGAALEKLVPYVHRELRLLARNYLQRDRLNQTLQPTALVNEAWLRLLGPGHGPKSANRAQFLAIAARLMREVLVDNARAKCAAKRGSGNPTISLDQTEVLAPGRTPDVLELDEALGRLAQVDPRKAKVIEFRYFGGMDRAEIASALDVTIATVKRDLRLGEAWLRRFLAGGCANGGTLATG